MMLIPKNEAHRNEMLRLRSRLSAPALVGGTMNPEETCGAPAPVGEMQMLPRQLPEDVALLSRPSPLKTTPKGPGMIPS